MKQEFLPYELAVKLKELGFDEPCLAYYQKSAVIGDATILPIQIRNKASNFNNNEYSKMGVPFCSAPLYQQAFRWFREKYDLDSYIMPARLETKKVYDFYIWFTNKEGERDLFIGMNNEYTYEEAKIECLNKLITTLK